MDQISSSPQEAPTMKDIMTLIYETQRISRESAADFDRRMKETEQARLKSQEEYEQLKKENELLKKANERARQKSREEFDRLMKEEKQARLKSREEYELRMKKLDEQIAKTEKTVSKMSENFISQSGHIVEGLMEPCAMKIFQEYGFELDKCWKNMEGRDKKTGREMEIDLFLHDTTDSVAVEVKIHCTKKKIVHFLEQMQMFKQIFTEFANKNIYVAVAAINFDKEAVKYAREKGVFLIHAKDDVFTLEPADKDKMLCF